MSNHYHDSSTFSIMEELIPDELLALMLSFLTPPSNVATIHRAAALTRASRDLARASLVCRRWYRVSSDPSVWSVIVRMFAAIPEVAALIHELSFHTPATAAILSSSSTSMQQQQQQQQQQLLQQYQHHSNYDRLAPKRIATTILASRTNILAAKSKRYRLQYHLVALSCWAAAGAWVISGTSTDICVWHIETLPTRAAAASSSSSSSGGYSSLATSTSTSSSSSSSKNSKRACRMKLHSIVNIKSRALVAAVNEWGVAAIGLDNGSMVLIEAGGVNKRPRYLYNSTYYQPPTYVTVSPVIEDPDRPSTLICWIAASWYTGSVCQWRLRLQPQENTSFVLEDSTNTDLESSGHQSLTSSDELVASADDDGAANLDRSASTTTTATAARLPASLSPTSDDAIAQGAFGDVHLGGTPRGTILANLSTFNYYQRDGRVSTVCVGYDSTQLHLVAWDVNRPSVRVRMPGYAANFGGITHNKNHIITFAGDLAHFWRIRPIVARFEPDAPPSTAPAAAPGAPVQYDFQVPAIAIQADERHQDITRIMANATLAVTGHKNGDVLVWLLPPIESTSRARRPDVRSGSTSSLRSSSQSSLRSPSNPSVSFSTDTALRSSSTSSLRSSSQSSLRSPSNPTSMEQHGYDTAASMLRTSNSSNPDVALRSSSTAALENDDYTSEIPDEDIDMDEEAPIIMYNAKLLRVLSGHMHGIRDVRLLDDCDLVASASFDLTVRVWSIESGASLFVINDILAAPHIHFTPFSLVVGASAELAFYDYLRVMPRSKLLLGSSTSSAVASASTGKQQLATSNEDVDLVFAPSGVLKDQPDSHLAVLPHERETIDDFPDDDRDNHDVEEDDDEQQFESLAAKRCDKLCCLRVLYRPVRLSRICNTRNFVIASMALTGITLVGCLAFMLSGGTFLELLVGGTGIAVMLVYGTLLLWAPLGALCMCIWFCHALYYRTTRINARRDLVEDVTPVDLV